MTGMHLSTAHGHTIDEVRASGLPVCAEIPVDTATRTGASMALAVADCLRGMTQLLARERPDFLLLLGDRGEMLAGAIAALHVGVPSVHVHGGERSGTVDEPVRHAISKLASYHFVATQGSRERLVRMGEDEARIFVAGAPGLDGLAQLGAMSRQDCTRALGLSGDAPFILAVFHPVVQQAGQAGEQTRAVLEARGPPRTARRVARPQRGCRLGGDRARRSRGHRCRRAPCACNTCRAPCSPPRCATARCSSAIRRPASSRPRRSARRW